MKHVVLDARSLREQRDGLATYLAELVPRVVAQSAGELRTTVIANPVMVGFWTSAADADVVPSTARPMRLEQHWRIPRLLGNLKADLYFYPAHDPPALVRTPFIFTIQDVIPHQISPSYDSLNFWKTRYAKAVTAVGVRRAAVVLVSSNAVREAIGEVFGAGFVDRVRVIPFGVEVRKSSRLHNGNGRCLLYVGTDRPHKNIGRLVRAYALARRRHAGVPPLKLAGVMRHPDRLRRVIQEAGVSGSVVALGHISDDELDEAIARATAVVVPSLEEGFGLPILEAMARGVPVVCSDRPACAETAGDAAVLFDPYDVNSIADGIVRVVADANLRRSLRLRGLARAATFSWERCASQTLNAIKDGLRRS